jgi:hypothetical protein
MDCRQVLQILDFEDRNSEGLPLEIRSAEFCSVDERAAAEAHLESCPTCARLIRSCRDLDRTIGGVMRSVPIPRGAQQRLLARLSEAAASGANAGDPDHAYSFDAEEPVTTSPAVDAPLSVPARAPTTPARFSRRQLLKALPPLAVCVVVAMAGFFGVVWFFTPRWTVDDISKSLAEIDLQSLHSLADFSGKASAAHLAEESGWQQLQWPEGRRAKGLPLAPSVIAVYGFTLPETRGHAAISGLIAVIPQNLVRTPPAADSLAVAIPDGAYLPAKIGESSCVAWRQGDVVCVCLIQGGGDSLSTLQNALAEPAA